METSKRPDLLLLTRVLDETGTAYALIGGLALQIHQAEPRTTLDIDIAVLSPEAIPRQALVAAGFAPTGTFSHSENWKGPGGTPVQFSADPAFAEAVQRALRVPLADTQLRVVSAIDLVRAKLRAAADPERRESKRLRDLADIQELLEEKHELAGELSPAEHQALTKLLPR